MEEEFSDGTIFFVLLASEQVALSYLYFAKSRYAAALLYSELPV
jgi:hypothetical protein